MFVVAHVHSRSRCIAWFAILRVTLRRR